MEKIMNRDEMLAACNDALAKLNLTEDKIVGESQWEELKGMSKPDLDAKVQELAKGLSDSLSAGNAEKADLKKTLLTVEGGLMTKGAMQREKEGNSATTLHDVRCDVIMHTRVAISK